MDVSQLRKFGCLFTQQYTANKGGGMRNYLNSHPTVTNCVFEDDRADAEDSFIE